MSSRALRKAQREKEDARLRELEEKVRQLENDDASGGDDGVEDAGHDRTPAVQKSVFALLGDEEEDPESSISGEEGENPDVEDPEIASKPQSETKPSKRKKKKKKSKQKQADGTANADATKDGEDLDEIDQALRQLSPNGQDSQTGAGDTGHDQSVSSNQVFLIDTSHLHAANELRRLFGRTALEDDNEEEQGPHGAAAGGNRRQQRRVQQVGLAQALRGQRQDGRAGGLSAIALRRNIFIQGKENWPSATGGGLGMEVEEKRADGTVQFRFVHNSTYRDVQSQFESCVASMDPNRLVILLQHNPYHISTLLQVSEIAKQERDHATSGDLLERALFSFGRAVHSTFAKSLAVGKARLSFDRKENREFWLASWRYMQNLCMRALWRTVYEWGKLLLSLCPEEDPYAMWLVLDQYALRSRQELDYLNISKNLSFRDRVRDLPNVLLSQGLAEWRAGKQSKGKQALFAAIGKHPWVIARVMQEIDVDPPPMIWGKQPRTQRETLYTELYAAHAKDLWSAPETAALLLEIASAIPPETPPAAESTEGISLSEARHIILLDEPALIAHIPRQYTTRMTSASDPLPPNDDASSAQDNLTERRQPTSFFSDIGHILEELARMSGYNTDALPWHRRPEDTEQRDGEEDDVDETDRTHDNDEIDLDEEQLPEISQEERELQLRRRAEFAQMLNSGGFPQAALPLAERWRQEDEERLPHDMRATVEDASDDDE